MSKKWSFDQDEVKQDLARPKLAPGNHAIVVTGVSIGEQEKGDYTGTKKLVLSQACVADVSDPTSIIPGTNHKRFLDIPLRNPDVDGHQYPKYATQRMTQFLAALGRVSLPVYNRTDKTYYLDGDPVDRREFTNMEIAAGNEAKQFCADGLEAEDFNELVGSAYIATIGYSKNKDTGEEGDFPNFNDNRAALRDGEELVAEAMTTGAPVQTTETPAPAPARKTAAKPAPAKKGGKR